MKGLFSCFFLLACATSLQARAALSKSKDELLSKLSQLMRDHCNFKMSITLKQGGATSEIRAAITLSVDRMDKEAIGFSIRSGETYAWKFLLPWSELIEVYISFPLDDSGSNIYSEKPAPRERSPFPLVWIQLIFKEPVDVSKLVTENGSEKWVPQKGNAAAFAVHEDRYAEAILLLIREIASRQGAQLTKKIAG